MPRGAAQIPPNRSRRRRDLVVDDHVRALARPELRSVARLAREVPAIDPALDLLARAALLQITGDDPPPRLGLARLEVDLHAGRRRRDPQREHALDHRDRAALEHQRARALDPLARELVPRDRRARGPGEEGGERALAQREVVVRVVVDVGLRRCRRPIDRPAEVVDPDHHRAHAGLRERGDQAARERRLAAAIEAIDGDDRLWGHHPIHVRYGRTAATSAACALPLLQMLPRWCATSTWL